MSKLFDELRRRNVIKVTIAYAIVAWLLVQVVVSIEEPLHLPEWLDTVVIVLLSHCRFACLGLRDDPGGHSAHRPDGIVAG
jgi:hypothetical protein